MSKIPLGQCEGARLEFKQAEVLAQPEAVAREVVGLLNAEGGEVWIGLAEEHGRAARVTPVGDAARTRGRLLDHLLDTIEPTPGAAEVGVEIVTHEAGELLVVRVAQGARPPYAQVKGNQRCYVKRTGDRLRMLARDELRDLFRTERGPEDVLDLARRSLREERERRQEEHHPGLWLACKTVAPLAVDLARWRDHLLDPTLTGGRHDGYSFASPHARVVPGDGEVRAAVGTSRALRLRQSGEVRFEAGLESLRGRGLEPGAAPEIQPYALIGYVVSVLRLAAAVLAAKPPGRSAAVVADIALLGVRGWVLRPYLPEDLFRDLEPCRPCDSDDVLAAQPLLLPEPGEGDRTGEADRWAWRLLAVVYEGFGLRPEHIPLFDPRSGRFAL